MGGVYFEEPPKDEYTDVSGTLQYRMKNVYPPLCLMPQRPSANNIQQQQLLLFPLAQPHIYYEMSIPK